MQSKINHHSIILDWISLSFIVGTNSCIVCVSLGKTIVTAGNSIPNSFECKKSCSFQTCSLEFYWIIWHTASLLWCLSNLASMQEVLGVSEIKDTDNITLTTHSMDELWSRYRLCAALASTAWYWLLLFQNTYIFPSNQYTSKLLRIFSHSLYIPSPTKNS